MHSSIRIITQFALSLMVVIPLGMLLFPAEVQPLRSPANLCRSHQQQVALGMFQYSQDYDEKYPLVKVSDIKISDNNPWGWADALQPYLKSNSLLHCPENFRHANKPRPANPQSWRYTDYFYNRRLSGINLVKVKQPTLTILTGDGDDGTGGTSARYSLSALPQKWRYDNNSPSYRHQDKAYYAFADGHIALIRPGAITTHPVQDHSATFSVQ